MEKMKVEQRIITTVPVHGHQNRLIYVLTIVLIAKIIIFWLLGIRQGGYSSNLGGVFTKKFPIAFSKILYVDFICISTTGVQGGSSGHWIRSYGNSSFSGTTNFNGGSPFLWTALGI